MRRFGALLMLACGLLAAVGAKANITINAVESGSNVVFTFAGSIDTSQFVFQGHSNGTFTDIDFQEVFNMRFSYDQYLTPGSTAPAFFPINTNATVGTGDSVGVYSGSVFLPTSYVSNTPISSTMTFANKSFSTLGLTAGTYVWTLTGGQTVTLTVASAPIVTSISPTSGSTAGGTVITITGTNLLNATGITVGGTACTTFNVTSATSATCTTPAGTVGTASVVVTTAGGSNAANTLFTYTAVPAAVPTLSEWSQMLLGLMVLTMIGWHFHRERSY